MKIKKIGIDIRAIGKQRTGDEYYTLNLVRNLLKIDKKNQYFLLTNTAETQEIKNKVLKGLENKNVEIISILPSFKLIWTFFLLPKIAKKLDLDVLHVQYITPLWLSNKIELITTIHDVSFKAFPEFIKKADLFFLNIFIPLSLKKADKIIAISEFTKKEIIKYYQIKKEKISVIYNGGTSDFFNEKNKNSSKILNKIGIEKPYLFYVGTHQPRKNISTLMKVFLNLKASNKKFKDHSLVLGGKLKAYNYDPEIDEILEKTKKDPNKKKFLKDLIFTGYIENEDLVGLYEEADIFIFPSLYEGFGLPLIEAMVSETPVICSDIDCFKEVGAGAARYFKAGDWRDLQKNIIEVIIDKKIREELIKKGEERAKFFSWDKTVKEFLKIL